VCRENPGWGAPRIHGELLKLGIDIGESMVRCRKPPSQNWRTFLDNHLTQLVSIRLVLHWQGGDHTQVEFQKLRSGKHRYAADKELVDIVGALARIEPDVRIAAILNRNQRRTAHGQVWTAARICSLRNYHEIPVYCEGEREARKEMFVGEASDLLGVTSTTVLRLIQLKKLSATQACVGAPWIMRRADVERCKAERDTRATPPTVDSKQLPLEIR
jgi:excisionase family DNA binding protein